MTQGSRSSRQLSKTVFKLSWCQMQGRKVDDEALSRRLIESTANAYQLWKRHDLRDIYEPNTPTT